MTDQLTKLTLPDWQEKIHQLVTSRGWQKDNIYELYFLFQEEVGEVTKAIREREKYHLEQSSEQEPVSEESDPEHEHLDSTNNLSAELADVFFYLLDIANFYDIDLAKACHKKLQINEQRNWT